MSETYEQMRERHAKEVRDWVRDAFDGGKSVNRVSSETGVNVGTIWRLKRHHVEKEETS